MPRALELAELGPARGVNPGWDASSLPRRRRARRGMAPRCGHAAPRSTRSPQPSRRRGARCDRDRDARALQPHGPHGPCAQALVEAGVARVVYAVDDPGDHSSLTARNSAARRGRARGGVLADEVEAFLDDWLFAARHRRPRVTVKWASSLDGRAAAADGTSRWITGAEARADVHRAARHPMPSRWARHRARRRPGAHRARRRRRVARGAAHPVVFGRRECPWAPPSSGTCTRRSRWRAPTSRPISRSSAPRHPLAVHRGRPDARELVPRGRARRRGARLPRPVLIGRAADRDRRRRRRDHRRRPALRLHRRRRLGDDVLVVAAARRRAPRTPTREESPTYVTGIIEELGEVTRRAERRRGARLTVRRPIAVQDMRHGDSIAVSGVCLTVVDFDAARHRRRDGADAVTMSTLDDAPWARREPSARPWWATPRRPHRAGAHRRHRPRARGPPGRGVARHPLLLDDAHAPLVVDKGSIAVDGVSLTVSALGDEPDGSWFEVSLIPETLTATTLGRRELGDLVNLETDVLARHVQRMLRLDAHHSLPSSRTGRGRSREPRMSLATIPEVLDALRAGKPVIVADDEGRENEGDAIMAAEFATQEWIAWMVRHTSGLPLRADDERRRRSPRAAAHDRAQRGRARHGVHDLRRRGRPHSTGIAPPTARTRCACWPTRPRRPRSSSGPATSCPCAPSTAAFANAAATPRAAVDLMLLAGLPPSASSARSSRRRRDDALPDLSRSARATGCRSRPSRPSSSG